MAAKQKAKKPLAKKAMKKTKGGAAYIKFDGVDGEIEAQRSRVTSLAVTFDGAVS